MDDIEKIISNLAIESSVSIILDDMPSAEKLTAVRKAMDKEYLDNRKRFIMTVERSRAVIIKIKRLQPPEENNG